MKLVLTTQVGADGVLAVTVPLGQAAAATIVRVVVETVDGATLPAAPVADREGWQRFIERTAGSITDPTFERHAQGDYEERDRLS
jgi:hypothetical protein